MTVEVNGKQYNQVDQDGVLVLVPVEEVTYSLELTEKQIRCLWAVVGALSPEEPWVTWTDEYSEMRYFNSNTEEVAGEIWEAIDNLGLNHLSAGTLFGFETWISEVEFK